MMATAKVFYENFQTNHQLNRQKIQYRFNNVKNKNKVKKQTFNEEKIIRNKMSLEILVHIMYL